MATTELTAENFTSTITENDIVLVDFWADWCQPCKRFGPVYEKASNANPDITFAKLDTEANQDVAAGLGITSIPTVMAFREGVLVFNQAGALNGAQLDQVITAVKELDMEAVHAEVKAARQQESAAE
ncbi:thioredoxin [Auraticoccus sp. F435]|uniref:Thioredoxin n=1 Tax=Auraticoccus cholistanensis TaxID=2656650 RepID=A0A6A9V174_9ACTN|nr:thioredoxin [Auraticoccus cholistanensis]MVA76600.1 thioredoxin [Auraticoccus cholistanensis]